MPDYNLGRAEGEIVITADTRGAKEAQVAMASTAAEAAALDAAMGRVNRSFDENRRASLSSAEAIVQARGEVEELRRAYQRQQEEYERGQQRVNDAAERARDILRDQREDLDALREARVALDRAEEDAERLRQRAADSYEAYQAKLIAVRQEVERFNAAHVGASAGFRNMRNEAEKFGEVLESITEKLSAVARVLGQAGLFGLFGGAAAGSLFASGASALNLLAGAMSVVVDIANSFVGAMALIPAGVNAAVLALGSLAISFHGVGAAITSIGDPKKFMESIKELSPAAKQVALTIQSFTESFRGARYEMQESLFQPIMADIQPLIRQWLPELMQAGKAISNEWGQAFHQVFEYFKQPDTQSAFKTFTNNLVVGFQAARGAIQPFLTAWNTLATVGSGVFERLGVAITDVATKFNAWIQRTSQSGELLAFMNKALDGFTNMGRIIRDVALGINNVFQIFQTGGKGTLENLASITAQFRAWTESVSGQDRIFSFFSLLRTAADAVRPQLKLLGDALGIIGGTLTRLGIAIQPGLNAFFISFRDALAGLSPYVIQLAPAINQFLAAFGQTLQQVVASIGPQLPGVMKSLSDAFVQLMQVIPPIVDVMAKFLSHVTPGQIAGFIALVGALKLLSGTIAVVQAAFVALDIVMALNPFGLMVVAIGALIAAGALLIANWDEVSSAFKRVWDSISTTVSGWWDTAYEWGRNLIVNLGKGISDAANSTLTAVIDAVASLFPDSWLTHSPARRGPLSQTSPNEMGSRLVSNFAAGMGEGSPSVTAATDDIAGRASAIGGSAPGSSFGAGFGNQSFSSAGISGRSGRDFSQGNSGFDQWVSFITRDLTAWNNIFQQAFSLVDAIGNIVTNTVRVAANLWNGGDNPLTRPGGLMGPPLPISQQEVPGVPNRPIPGVAPDQYGKDLAAANGLPGQEDVPGVPRRGQHGNQTAPTTPAEPPAAPTGPNGTPPVNPPAQTQGQAPPSTQGAPVRPLGPPAPGTAGVPAGPSAISNDVAAGNVWNIRAARGDSREAIAAAIIQEGRRRGLTDEQIQAAGMIAGDETNFGTPGFNTSGGNASVGGVGGTYQQSSQAGWGTPEQILDPRYSISKFYDIYTENLRRFGDIPPINAAILTQNPQLVTQYGIAPGELSTGSQYGRQTSDAWNGSRGNAGVFARALGTLGPRTAPIQPSAPAVGAPAAGVGSPQDDGDLDALAIATLGAAGAGGFAASLRRILNKRAAGEVLEAGEEALVKEAGKRGISTVPESSIGKGTPAVSPADANATKPIPRGPATTTPESIAPADTRPAGTARPTAPPAEVRGPGGARLSPLGAKALAGGAALNVLLTLPWAWDTSEALVRYDNAKEARERGEKPTFDESDFGRNILGPGGGIDSSPASRPMTPEELDKYAPKAAPPPPATPASTAGRFTGTPPGNASAFGPWGIPSGQVSGIVPINDPNFLALGQYWGGLLPSTYGGHQVVNGKNEGIDWGAFKGWTNRPGVAYDTEAGRQIGTEPGGSRQLTREEADRMTAFAKWIGTQAGVEQTIWMNPYTGEKVGFYNGKPVGPGTDQPGYYRDDWTGHSQHVHTRNTQILGAPDGTGPVVNTGQYPTVPVEPTKVGPESTQTPVSGRPAAPSASSSDWMNVPDGWDLDKPIPKEVIAKNMPSLSKEQLDSLPPMYYNARPGTVSNVPVPADYNGKYQVSPGGTISVPTSTGSPTPGFPETNDQRTPMEKFTAGMQAMGSIAGDAFTVFQDVIASIGAAANITDTLVRGFENTETVVNFIQQFQTFIKTGADIAKLVGDSASAIGSMIPSAGGADFGGTEGAKAALGAVSAVASIVQSAFEATNAAISLGIDIYHEVGKYAGFLFGGFLGGPNTGPLGGNVRMLLNTRTNQLQTYSEDNPGNKNTFNVPLWQRSYTQQQSPPSLPPQVNIYTGPGQTPREMMNESMWAISTGSAPVVSVAGQD